jgi:hypothetical protein
MQPILKNITALLIITTVVCCSVQGQDPDLEQILTVNYKKVPLAQVIEDIHNKSKIEFSFSSEIIPVDYLVTYSGTKSVKTILNEILLEAGVEYHIIGDYLILKKHTIEEQEPEIIKPKRFTFSGTVTDQNTKETLIGAAIYNKATGIGTLSNNYGFYSLSLPKGNYEIEISYLGYTRQSYNINLVKDVINNINLKPNPSLMEEIIITSEDKEKLVFTSLAGQINIRPFEVYNQNAVLGETDMLKSLENLPGISFHNEGSSYFYVRGGHRDQNLILLDEAPIYNPSHLLGLFTPIIPEAIKQTTIYKADFPVQYGGRLSSTIDIRTKDGNMEKISGNGNLGLISTRINFEGPFKKNTSSYFVSFRRSHLGMFFKAFIPAIDEFYFNDVNLKFNLKIGQKDRLFLTLYSGKDSFLAKDNTKKTGLQWSNTSATLRWNHVFGNRLFANTTIYSSKYDYYLHTDYDKDLYWNSQISSTNLKTEFTWFIHPKVKSCFGINLGGYFFNPGNYSSPEITKERLVSKVNSSEVILYAGNEQELAHWLKFNYGVRLVNWSNIGEAFIIEYDDQNLPLEYINYDKGERYYSNTSLEPRVSVSLKTGKSSSIKLSFNKTIQHINMINNSISPYNSLEVWIPSGPNIKPQHAYISNLGYMKTTKNQTVDFHADIFYKRMYNQIGYSYHAEMILNPYIEGELLQGDGKAYGFEIMVKKTKGRLTGQIGYGFIRSMLKIDGLNGNRSYPAHQDKPFDLTLSFGYALFPRWLVNGALNIASGMRITTPTGFYYYRGDQVPIYTRQNNQALPLYKRIDVGTSIRLNPFGQEVEHYLNFAIYNFFAAQNPAFINFNKTIDSEGKIIIPADKTNTSELIPTFRYTYGIIPSINYNLKF